jgi:hypothetical protein
MAASPRAEKKGMLCGNRVLCVEDEEEMVMGDSMGRWLYS